MNKLKKLKLNSHVLEDFDKFMSYHLDQVEELEIDEIIKNSRLYDVISLCTNVKQLTVKGDLRIDINKIMFNICKPEKVETLVFDSIKLPTVKNLPKFTNLQTISLTNITFSNLGAFFSKISNKQDIVALNLTNVDFGKKPFSICEVFENLKYFNVNGLKNCIFDDFDFIYENKNMQRFEFNNNEIKFNQIASLCKGNYIKNIRLKVESLETDESKNYLEIHDNNTSVEILDVDLPRFSDTFSFYKLDNLSIILSGRNDITKYIRTLKKVKERIHIDLYDISYLSVETAIKLQDKLNVEKIGICFGETRQIYLIENYIKIRKEFDTIINKIPSHISDFQKFNEIYNYFKNEVEYNQEANKVKNIFIDKKSSYNLYAMAIKSCLTSLNVEAKIICGTVEEEENLLWNQIKVNDRWYNCDLAYEIYAKQNKKIFQYAFRDRLLDDEIFYKTHIPVSGKPEICEDSQNTIKKDLKSESAIKRVFDRIFGIFKFNKLSALPAPEREEHK